MICEKGGKECLQIYIQKENSTDGSYVVEDDKGNNYTIYTNGTVVKNNTEVICEDGGIDCLIEYLKVTVHVDGNGNEYVVINNGTVIYINNTDGGSTTIIDLKPNETVIDTIDFNTTCKIAKVHNKYYSVCSNGTIIDLSTNKTIFTNGTVTDIVDKVVEEIKGKNITYYKIGNETVID